ncbi:PPE domain-containing protein [Pseudonocardia alni]|uniref:PPE domain-containing protein n=1 Tax=Pseudonocardia alni TaxID=33907 RepID=UPI00332ABE28
MTAPRWAGLSHAEIVAMVTAGPGPSASAGAERAWRDAAAALTDVHRELSGQVRDLPGGWSGGTADGVTVAFGSLDGWVVSAAVDAGRTADALAAQAGLAADLRARMPAAAAPTPPETAPTGPALLDDWAAADLAAGNSAGRAAELMVRYDNDTRVTGAPWTGWGASPVVTHDGTAPASTAVPVPSPGGPPPGPGGDVEPAPAGGAASGTTVFAGIGLGGITAAVLTGNGRAGVPGARPIDVGGPSSGPDPADASATDTPRTGTPGTPGTDTGPGTGDLGAGPASPAGAGVPGGGGADPGGGTAVTAAVLAGGALGGAGILIGATIRRERQSRDGRRPAEDGTTHGHPRPGDDLPPGRDAHPADNLPPEHRARAGDDAAPGPEGPGGDTTPGGTPRPGDAVGHGTPSGGVAQDPPGDAPPSGAEHRPPSGDATTSGTRAPSGAPAADGGVPWTPGGPHPDGASPGGPAPGALTSDRPSPDGTGGGTAPGDPDGPRSPVQHGVITGDLAVPHTDGPAPHGAVTHARHAPPPMPAPGDPAVTPAGVPVGAVPAAPHPVAATVGAPADPRIPAWRLVADEHATPDDPPEQPDARPDLGVLRPDARWRGRG